MSDDDDPHIAILREYVRQLVRTQRFLLIFDVLLCVLLVATIVVVLTQ